MATKKNLIGIFLILALMMGCAGIPVREEVKVDLSLPVGKIQENQFTGIRYPFKVSAPSHWKVTTEVPNFMVELGYEKPGLEESEVFLFNPSTQSNIQIDFTSASRYSRFSQEKIEWMTNASTEGTKEELQHDYGKDLNVDIGPTEPVMLKGVPYAAKKYVAYSLREGKREQGWIYAFSEPYQIFILYMILEKEGSSVRQDMNRILESFEYIPKK